MIKKIEQILKTPFGRNTIIRVSLYSGLLVIALMTAVLLIFWKPASEPLPLVYTSFYGAIQTGPWFVAYQFPLLALAVLLINNSLAYAAYPKDRLISYLLSSMASVVGLIFLTDVINLVLSR